MRAWMGGITGNHSTKKLHHPFLHVSPLPPSCSVLMEHWTTAPPAVPWGEGTNRRAWRTRTSSSWRTHTTHCSSSNDTASHSDCSCNPAEQSPNTWVFLRTPHKLTAFTLAGRCCTLLSALLVMLALVARWATKAASKAAAALWDWMHVNRTCCHQGETDCGSHDSSTAPKNKGKKKCHLCFLKLFPLDSLIRTHTVQVAKCDEQRVQVSDRFHWFLKHFLLPLQPHTHQQRLQG